MNLKKLRKDFDKNFKASGSLRDALLSEEKLEQWFDNQPWSRGNEGAWERFTFLLSLFSDQPADPLLVCRILPLTGMETEDVPDDHWPFPIQHPLKRILEAEESLHLQTYITLFEAMVHLHFVVLGSQYYWTMEGLMAASPDLEKTQAVRCAYQTLFESLTDKGCMGGNVWAERAGLISAASAEIQDKLPFPELIGIMEPEKLVWKQAKDKEDRPVFILSKWGRVLDLIKFTANIRNKMAHWEEISEDQRDQYQEGLSLIFELLRHVFRRYHRKPVAVIHEIEKHPGIFCYWDGVRPFFSNNKGVKRKIRRIWNQAPREGLDMFPGPVPPNPLLTWDESLLLFDPEDPYTRSVYLMPLGFRFSHRMPQIRKKENIYPGLVDSVRWLKGAVHTIIQRTYAGIGPDVCVESKDIPDDEGVDRTGHLKSLERIAVSIRDRYHLEIPKTARVFGSVRPEFDLGHSREALRLADPRHSVPRVSELDRLEKMLLGSPHQRVLMTGPSGSGKTFVAAQFFQRMGARAVYLSFDCGIPHLEEPEQVSRDQEEGSPGQGPSKRERERGPTLSAPVRMHYISGLCGILNVEQPSVILPEGEAQLRIRSLMKDTADAGPVFLIIDGLNQCPDPEQALIALPDPLPERLYVLVTTQPVDMVLRQARRDGKRLWTSADLALLAEAEAREIIRFYWNPPGEKKSVPLSDRLIEALWEMSRQMPVFIREWTLELRRIYHENHPDFEAKALALLKSQKGLNLPETMRQNFERILTRPNPRGWARPYAGS